MILPPKVLIDINILPKSSGKGKPFPAAFQKTCRKRSLDSHVIAGDGHAQVLTGEADISTMPIEYAPQFTKKYNAEICADLGLEMPSDYVAVE